MYRLVKMLRPSERCLKSEWISLAQDGTVVLYLKMSDVMKWWVGQVQDSKMATSNMYECETWWT